MKYKIILHGARVFLGKPENYFHIPNKKDAEGRFVDEFVETNDPEIIEALKKSISVVPVSEKKPK